MSTYIARRIVLLFPTLIGVMTITFVLISALPVVEQITSAEGPPNPHSPCGYQKECLCTAEGEKLPGYCPNPLYDQAVSKLGLDKPVPVQYISFLYRAFTFQWGTVDNFSAVGETYPFSHGESVATFLGQVLPYTLELAMLALAVILAISIPLGNLAAVYRNRPIDQVSRVVSFSGFAIPPFLLGTLTVFGVYYLLLPHTGFSVASPWCTTKEPLIDELTFSWPQKNCFTGPVLLSTGCPAWLTSCLVSSPTGFPTIDAAYHGYYWMAADTLVRMILPALVIAYGSIATLLRFVRNSMLEVMNLDYVRTARAKGVPEGRVISRHAGRNSLNVTITVLGLTFAFFLGGFPVIEFVFTLNGIGRALALAVLPGHFDFGVIFGTTLLFTYIVVTANILVDVLYAYLDPRVRLG
jgi:peptide/nickel transport system permease protein